MSTIRDPAYITNAGRTMMTAGGEVTYTKAVLYGQDISGLSDSQIKALTSLGNPLREVKIGVSDKQSSDSGSTVILEAVFQNNDLKADLEYKAVGFFARKNDVEQLVIVAVANQGAYLAATNPDGVATDALDLKIAVKIGDATSVTAVIDPAGSVTPATLNGAINKATHDLTAKIDTKADKTDVTAQFATKADKTTVESDLATKADQSSLDETNAEVAKKADSEDVTKQLATKANASDVADNVKTLQANIDTKADKATVDAEIAKIDFTPYAKSADVAKDLQGYTTTADLTKLLAGKRDIADSYSRDELDKKFLQLSTDTSGKVSADQIAKLLASKVDKTDLTSQLQAITDSIGTKANSANVTAELAKKDNTADVDAKIKTVTDLANTKANASDVYNKQAIDTAFSQRDSNLTTLQNNLQGQIDKQVNSTWAIDNNSGKFNAVKVDASGNSTQSFTQPGLDLLNSQVDKINQLKGNRVVDAVDFNTLTDTGVYYVTNSNSSNKNAPVPQWGTLVVSNGNDHRLSQIYFPDDNNAPWYRTKDEGNWLGWQQLSTKSDVNNAVNSANSASARIDTVLGNSYFIKQGMNENGDLVAIRGNATKQTNGGYAFDIWSSDWTASKLKDVLGQLPSKANASDVAALQGKVNVTTPLFREISADSTWEDIFGVTNPTNVLTSLRINPGGNGQLVNDYAAGIGFGGSDTKAVISVDYYSHVARFTAGNGTSPGWSEDVAWKSDIDRLQSIINQQNQTIQSLTTRLTNAENEINYIKANYVEGRTFPASQEAQANSWENANPQRIAFIEK
ncbi:pyocin knob domain-containing protein [Lactobacillus gallinarum]|uniref:pyocin knob domain-containing protein n=1 Tax=Lactobacillus gallinarum TaxID=52242 RepID=UPI00388F99A4